MAPLTRRLTGRLTRCLTLAGGLVALACAPSGGGSTTPAPAGQPAETATRAGARPGAGAGGSRVLYQPGTAAYSLQRRDSLVLELPDAPPQAQIFDRTAYLRVALAEGVGRLRATITLDSIRAATPGLVPPDSLRAAEGTVWTGAVTTKGLSELSADRATSVGEQLVGALHGLFPALLPEGAREGAEWQDTSTVAVRLSAFSMTEQAITTYHALGQETRDGHRALRLESTATVQSSGSGQQFGQAIEISASGGRRGMYLLGTDGVLVAAEGSDSTDMTLSVPAVGQSVPAKQHSTVRITLLSKATR